MRKLERSRTRALERSALRQSRGDVRTTIGPAQRAHQDEPSAADKRGGLETWWKSLWPTADAPGVSPAGGLRAEEARTLEA